MKCILRRALPVDAALSRVYMYYMIYFVSGRP
jgi:hypothetical protein